MTTALELLNSSARLATILASGETLTSDEAIDGLKVLNDLLENWSTERLSVWSRDNQVFPLVLGTATYTIGPGGNFSTTRPVRVSNSFVRVLGADFPVTVWGQGEYDQVAVKNVGGIPERMLYVNDTPLGTLTLYPVPSNQPMDLHLSIDRLLSFPLIFTTVLAFPPGYERALRFALAVNLASEYGIELSPTVHAIAKDSKADIKRSNQIRVLSAYDPALQGSPGFAYWQRGF